ncbi:MAG: YfiR family protein [Betaproteobacteria bacterium]
MRKFLLLCVSALVALSPLVALAQAQVQEDSATLERRVKAAFLYKFAGYVEWPDGTFVAPDAPIIIGVAGDDALSAELAQVVNGRSIEGRPLAVKRVRDNEALAGVHILFVSNAERARLGPLARATPSQPLLIISESDGALEQGSAINFLLSGGRVRFEIALDNAEKRALRLSSRLLSVAHSVRTGGSP